MRLHHVGLVAILAVACADTATQPEAEGQRAKSGPAFELSKNHVVLLEEMRFADSSGGETLVKPGIYGVERQGERHLSLAAHGSGQTILLTAGQNRHQAKLASPRARLIERESESGHLLALWHPDGETRVAIGLPTEVRLRGPTLLDLIDDAVEFLPTLDPGTEPDSTLLVSRPFHRSAWRMGSTHEIRWSGVGEQPPNVRIALFRETGEFVKVIARPAPNALADLGPFAGRTGNLLGAGVYSWTVDVSPGRYRIRVAHSLAQDFSDGFEVTLAVDGPDVLIAAGSSHNLAVLEHDRSAWGWGNTIHGELGQNLTGWVLSPISLGLSDVRAVAAGYGFSFVLMTDGTLWASGWNEKGQLGSGGPTFDGQDEEQREFKRVDKSALFQAISVGEEHTLALTVDGAVHTWGGWSVTTGPDPDYYPKGAVITGIGGAATAVAAGKNHSLALMSDGRVRAWGYGDWGLGDGTRTGDPSPRTVEFPSTVKIIAISANPYGHTSLALDEDGNVWTWGGGYRGWTLEIEDEPVQIAGLSDIRVISGGSLAIDGSGQLWSWRWRGDPDDVDGLADVVAVSGKLAVGSNGALWDWSGATPTRIYLR